MHTLTPVSDHTLFLFGGLSITGDSLSKSEASLDKPGSATLTFVYQASCVQQKCYLIESTNRYIHLVFLNIFIFIKP